ncbi:MAG: flagellar hook-basal body complex protein FliE [Chitinispirillaceae bacterium]
MRIDGIDPSQFPSEPLRAKGGGKGAQGPSFGDTLNSFLSDVNQMQSASSAAKRKFLTGGVTDVHQVMNRSEEAKVALNMLIEIRNKTLEAYDEIMRLRL